MKKRTPDDFFLGIDANVIRSRRQQASGSSYGNSNPSAGYNTNFYGTNLNNNQGSKDLYGNPMGSANAGNNNFNTFGVNNQQQQQQQQQLQQQQQHQQQMYGAGGQPLANPSL